MSISAARPIGEIRVFDRDHDSDGAPTPSGAIERAWSALSALAVPLDGVFGDPGVLRMPPLGDIR